MPPEDKPPFRTARRFAPGIEIPLRAWERRSPDRHRPPEAGETRKSVRLDHTALFG